MCNNLFPLFLYLLFQIIKLIYNFSNTSYNTAKLSEYNTAVIHAGANSQLLRSDDCK